MIASRTLSPAREWPRVLSGAVAWRLVLALAVVVPPVVVLGANDPGPMLGADPELARLLRSMAALKVVFALPGIALLWWRMGQPVLPLRGVCMALIAAGLAVAPALIWQLRGLAVASYIFHGAILALLAFAWFDSRPSSA